MPKLTVDINVSNLAEVKAALSGFNTQVTIPQGLLRLAQVRSRRIAFTYQVPVYYRGYSRAAYDCGYEAGFRGWELDNPYSTSTSQWRRTKAYNAGYADGDADARLAAENA